MAESTGIKSVTKASQIPEGPYECRVESHQ
jgi:hypothetical protein